MRYTKKMHGETFTYWECDKCGYDMYPECNDIYQVGDEHYCAGCLMDKFRKEDFTFED